MNQTSVVMPYPLLGRSLSDLTEWVKQQGQATYRGKQLHQWLYERGIHSIEEVSVFPKIWRQNMADFPIGRSIIRERVVAPDRTIKYLLQLADGEIIETVGIPSDTRITVCVSSQVGCPMSCDFCATGKGGFRRHLASHEIIDQILTVQQDLHQRVSHIVFMGMGEPLLNMDNVLAAIRCLNQDVGISQRAMTLSTVGIPGHIRRLAQHQLQVTLAVSLHAPDQALRERLIPSARHFPLPTLLNECRDYVQSTGRRISFEYVLLSTVNDREEQAAQLADRVGGFQSHVNLIPYNPINDADYQRPERDRIQSFMNVLKSRHIAVSVRYSRGLAANAACGQLRTSRGAQ